ncbi:Small RNA degrading nuclease 3 [Acorus calamus]|uniref:Small RNA degrading nuclease 3 n=1 Tax=Acorus calamus TaxID=4465 RepID=A0AAV9ED12_ACOCL|nr:Small RNA degrading nuclease 3 [Acorus calamus]
MAEDKEMISLLHEEIASTEKEILSEIVKLAQKQDMKGDKGSWKEFLIVHDRKFGAFFSDPSKRSNDILISFLKTFTLVDNLKFFVNRIRRYKNLKEVEQYTKSSSNTGSPQQRLVLLTMEHSQYKERYSFPSHNDGWMVTELGKISKAMKSKRMIAIDCEMVLCEDGTDAVVKVCVVDQNLEVKLDKFVNPNKEVADYRSEITGISAKDLEGCTRSLQDIQKSLKRLLRSGTILVGHTLYNDLQALKIDHLRVIDTSYIFEYLDRPTYSTPSLNDLCKVVLGSEVRKEGEPHNCLEDARAAMKLVLAKLEHGFNDPILIPRKMVSEADLAKLLLHGIPVGVNCQELQKSFPEGSKFEFQPIVKAKGKSYSIYVTFEDNTLACEAYKGIEAEEIKDSNGLPQKLVSLELESAKTISFYVRKMAPDTSTEPALPKKRPAQDESEPYKKQKVTLHQCNHVEEIEKLKLELKQKDEEILSLQKILSAVTRKHGL